MAFESRMLIPALALALGTLTACGGGVSQLSEATRAVPLELDFAAQPSYLPKNFLALTFDDGPDAEYTAQVLDVLREQEVKATFFVNTYNWSDVANEVPMQDLIRRVVAEGHGLGNHTARHQHLSELTDRQIETEIATVEQLSGRILGAGAAPLTLLRAPYGDPYLGNNPNTPSAAYKRISPIIARHAVHIGWAMDAADYDCPTGDADCVYTNVMTPIDEGRYGIVLMHATYAATVEALPRLIETLRARGFVLGTVEDAVKARFGRPSRELLRL